MARDIEFLSRVALGHSLALELIPAVRVAIDDALAPHGRLVLVGMSISALKGVTTVDHAIRRLLPVGAAWVVLSAIAIGSRSTTS